MNFLKKNWKGICLALTVAVPSWFLGKQFPIIGGPVIAILMGMILSLYIKDKTDVADGIKFTSKKVLQWAVILLGFGLNLNVVVKTGIESLPIICATIATSLIVSFILCKLMKIPSKISTLVGVGSSICGGSAVAATAPVIGADDEEVAQAISVIFFFNVLAAIIFPHFGAAIGFNPDEKITGKVPENNEMVSVLTEEQMNEYRMSVDQFGIFAGTAVNDTSSVTACASTWDSMYGIDVIKKSPVYENDSSVQLTLDKAVTVKLVRTLAIIPITLCLALYNMVAARKKKEEVSGEGIKFSKVFPFFIIWFILASCITTVCYSYFPEESQALKCAGVIFGGLKTLSKFFIVLAMAAIGINTNIVKLVKTGGKPLVMGLICWISITAVSVVMQKNLIAAPAENTAVEASAESPESAETVSEVVAAEPEAVK